MTGWDWAVTMAVQVQAPSSTPLPPNHLHVKTSPIMDRCVRERGRWLAGGQLRLRAAADRKSLARQLHISAGGWALIAVSV